MFDVLTIAAVADEIAGTLLDGRVQRIGLIDARTLATEVYAGGRRHALVASADDRRARLHLAAAMPSLDAELVTPFGLLLRKYVRGGVLIGVEQPPLERLVRLSIAKRLPPHNGRRRGDGGGERVEGDEEDEAEGEGDATYVHLAIELMGRHSNLILVDDEGLVMESAKRVTAAMSRVRPVQPRLPYMPPPPIDKPDPRRLTTPEADRLLAGERPAVALAPALVRWLRGISPQMAREIAFRVGGDAAVTVGGLPSDAAAPLAQETRALLEPLLTSTWSPRVYREGDARDHDGQGEGTGTGVDDRVIPVPGHRVEGRTPPSPAPPERGSPFPAMAGEQGTEPGAGSVHGRGTVVAFAPIPMAHLAAAHVEEAVLGISAAAELADGDGGEAGPVRHAQRRERLLAAVRAARQRQERRLAALGEQRAKAAEAETLREWGELIYGYLWQIAPGQTELVVDGVSVPLDPALSAKENAQAYFERYRKAQGAEEQLPDLEEQVATELAYLDQLRTLTEQAGGFAELEALAAEWQAHSGGPPERGRPTRRPAERRPRPLLDAAGNTVYVGHSGPQNDLITFDLAAADDTWLHARGVPGSHVVVRWRQPTANESPATIEAAAALAAFYSAARGGSSVEVDVTRRRHVRKIKGSGPGMVTYRNERTVAVRPADEGGVTGTLKAGR